MFDDENEEKIAAHGLTIAQVDQILDGEHLVVPIESIVEPPCF